MQTVINIHGRGRGEGGGGDTMHHASSKEAQRRREKQPRSSFRCGSAARPDGSATAAVAAPRQRERGKEAPWQLAEMIEG